MSDFGDQVFPQQPGPARLRRIVLEFESFRDFIQAFSPLVSEEGMFVETGFLPAGLPTAGEEVDFEVRLTDDFRLVHGRGEVEWVREPGDADGPSGAAVRFLDLDEPSRRLVSRLVNNYAKDGGKPFELKASVSEDQSAVEPEVLTRSEADELFASDLDSDSPEQQELDSVAPEVPEDVEEGSTEAVFDLGVEEEGTPAVEIPGFDEGDLTIDAAADALQMPLEAGEDPLDLEVGSAADEDDPYEAPVPAAPPVISDDIAQIAEELSGIHQVKPVEMPTEEDQVAFAGTARAKSSRGPWQMLLIASLAGVALGVAAWFLAGSQIKSWIGFDDPAQAQAEEVSARPAVDPEESLTTADELEAAEEGAAVEIREDPGSSASFSADSEVDTPAAPVVPPAVASPQAAQTRPGSTTQPEATSTAASRVERITWSESGGETVVLIRFDGAISDDSYEVIRIREGAPRELIKIFGISSPYTPNRLEVGTAHVQALRTGLHASDERSEMHVVADLAGPAAAVTLIQADGNTLRVTFS